MSHDKHHELKPPHVNAVKTTWGIILRMGTADAEIGKITKQVLTTLFGPLLTSSQPETGAAVIAAAQDDLTVRLYDEVLWPLTQGEIPTDRPISVSNLFASFASVFDMGELEAIDVNIQPDAPVDRILVVRALLHEAGSENIRDVTITRKVEGHPTQGATYHFGREWGGREVGDITKRLAVQINDARVLITAIPEIMKTVLAPVLRGVWRPELRLAVRNELAKALLDPIYGEVLGTAKATADQEYDTVTDLLVSGRYKFATMTDGMVSLQKDQHDPSGVALLRIIRENDVMKLHCLSGRPWDALHSWFTAWAWAADPNDETAVLRAKELRPSPHRVAPAALAVYDYIARSDMFEFTLAGLTGAQLDAGIYTRLQTEDGAPVAVTAGGLIWANSEPQLEIPLLDVFPHDNLAEVSDYLAQTNTQDTKLPLGVYENDRQGLRLVEPWLGTILLHALRNYQHQTKGAEIPRRFNIKLRGGVPVTFQKEGPFYTVRSLPESPMTTGALQMVLGEFTRHAPVYEVEQTNARH